MGKTLSEVAAMWRAKSAQYKKTHKWQAFVKKHMKKGRGRKKKK